MLRLLLLIILLPATAYVYCQVSEEDSIRVVVLETVNFRGKATQNSDRLYRFYTTNKAATTEDILARLPEISLVRRGSYGMEPVIRSFNSNQVNLLLDGMRIHGACTDKMDPVSIYIEPINLERIEIKTNGGSFLNGSSIGGSINMKVTDVELSASGLKGLFQSAYHTVSNSVTESLLLQYADKKFGIRASGTYRHANNYTDGKGNTVLYSGYEKVNYAIHTKFLLKDDLYLKADFIGDDGYNIGYAALPMDVGYAKARIAAVSILKTNLSANWEEIEAKLYVNAIDHSMDDSQRPNLAVRMDMPGKSRTKGMYLQGKNRINHLQSLQLKADVSYTGLAASMTMYQSGQEPMFMLTWPDNSQLQSALAAQFTHHADSLTQLQVNSRLEVSSFTVTSETGKDHLAVFGHTETDKLFLIPSVSFQVNRKFTHTLKASASLLFNGRQPSASEMYGFYLFNQFDGYDYIGNPGLKAEQGIGTEVSMQFKQRNLNINIAAYGYRVKNYITGFVETGASAMTMGANGVKMYHNLSHAKLWGTEGSVVYNFQHLGNVISTLRYTNGTDMNGKMLPMMAPLKWVNSYRHALGNLWLQAEFEIAASRRNVNMATGEMPTDGFSLLHFRGGYTIKGKKTNWELNAGVENILNKYYREHLDWGGIPRAGRNVYLQLSCGF